jgi:predicted metal-dependent peptidase
MTTSAQQLTRARAWVASRYPFLAVLALHLPEREARLETAATDGKHLLYNPEYVARLSDAEARGLLLHLVLHAAFGHPWRRGTRDQGRWDAAADIVVNGALRKLIGLSLPEGANRTNPSLEELSVEEIYEALEPDIEPPSAGHNAPSHWNESKEELEAYWKEAQLAAMSAGDAPGNLERHYPVKKSKSSWRTVLERYLIQAQHDYQWRTPDRRMMAFDLIYPALAGEGIDVAVVIDTSGSVPKEIIGAFLGELEAIKRSHPNLSGWVIYADADVQAEHPLERIAPPSVIGGGGTSFAPAFAALERRRFQPQVLIYLTDGDAEYPKAPTYPVIWALPKGSSALPPWGTVIRI